VRATIALDAMGGDRAPDAIVAGAVLAARECDVAIRIVGDLIAVETALAAHDGASGLAITIEHAPDVVGMDEAPLAALRRKPQASIAVACEAVAAGRAQAVVSAGHTGATVIAAHAALGRAPGVDRPALGVLIPTESGTAVLVDAGANVECRPEHLVQFGTMGSAYARVALGRQTPAVGILSIGEEAGKGTDVVREAHAALAAGALHFIGNIEARAIFTSAADVIVCDGFTGNVVLKVGEASAAMFERMLREATGAGGGDAALDTALSRFKARVDDEARGAAPLLGVNGLVLVAHGRSSPQAIRNAIDLAATLVEAGFVSQMTSALAATLPSTS
jgi:glycerol-3-phosphate acyltransferase PlsX